MKKIALVCMMLAALGVAFAGQVVLDDGKAPSKFPSNPEAVKIAPVKQEAAASVADLKSRLEMLEAEMLILENSGDMARMSAVKSEITEILNILEPPSRTYGSRLDATGDDCTDPYVWSVGAVPASLLSQTTCGRGHTYESVACFGSYATGEDMIIELNVTANLGWVRLALNPKGTTYGAVGIGTMCPPTTCLAYVGSSSGAVKYTGGFTCNAGTYYIMVDTWTTPDCIPDFDLTIEAAPAPPANDLCANAIAVAIPSVTAGTTLLATADAGIVSCGTATYSGRLGVWYKVIGNDHTLTAHTCATTFDTQLMVLADGCGVLTCVDGADEGCATYGGSSVSWCALSGVEYLIYIAHYGSSTGNFTLTIEDGDLCVSADGRCCYLDPIEPDPDNPLCAVNTLAECDALGGDWTMAETCLPDPPYGCPVPFHGEDCSDPAATITTLPYTNSGTNGEVDNYNSTTVTCISQYYDNGYDVIYKLIVDVDKCITIFVDQNDNGWMSVSLWDDCPDVGTCLVGAYSVSGDLSIPCTELEAGTYYIMLDNYPSPYEWTYTMTVDECECPAPCDDWVLCGTPTETEPNNVCGTETDAYVIGCNAEVYGKICPADDHDWFMVSCPPQTVMEVWIYDDTDCLTNPNACVRNDLYFDDCTPYAQGVGNTGYWRASNPSDDPFVFYLDFYALSGCQATYKIVSNCCDIVDYCATPIVVPAVFYYQETVNTCCATNLMANMGTNCATSYASGNDVVFQIRLEQECVLDSIHVEYPGADEQWWLATDCDDPVTTCVASQDVEAGVGAEVQRNITLPAGTYYLFVSRYGTTSCGPLTVTISGDCYLPVEFLGADALAGDGKVTVSWATASELNMDRYEIVRDGEMVKTIAASNTSQRHDYSWVDTDVTNGMSYSYDVVAVGLNGERNVLATVNATPSFEAGAVTAYALHQNYPNPFNPTTTLAFDLKDAGFVNLTVFNLMGQEVAKVVNGEMSAGRHTVNFNSGSLSSGIYLYRIEVNGFAAEKKMLLMK